MTASSPHPAAPDTTGGELREAARRGYERGRRDFQFQPSGDNHHNAALCPYCTPALRDLLAERDKLAAQVRAGLALTEECGRRYRSVSTEAIRRALGTPTTGGGE